MEKRSKIFSGVLAFSIYFFILGLLINYFNHHKVHKNIHFVAKNDHRIMVSLPDSSKAAMPPHPTEKTESKPKPKPKPKASKHPSKTDREKKVIKPKPSPAKQKKKKRIKKQTKKVDVHSLFRKVKERKPAEKKVKKHSNGSGREKKKRDRGVQNAYFAKVENMLQSWPAQSEFAGEHIKVWLRIQQDGSFTYKVLSASGNDDFNTALTQFLKQLQQIGFGRHQNSRPYTINVEFIAKE